MDHHCGIIGNCIGKGNYKVFLIFIIFMNLLVWLVISQEILYIVRMIDKFGQMLGR